MKTGFIHGFPNKPGKKRYSYHGLERDCLIQPDPDPFDDQPTYPPLGPEQTVIIISLQGQGWFVYDLDYFTARNASSGVGPYPGIGQRINPYTFKYSNYRFGVLFDTSILPDNLLIVEAKLKMRGQILLIGSRPWSVIVQHNEDRPHAIFDGSDYNYTHYSGVGGSADVSTGNYTRFTLNDLGISWIRPKGITRFYLRSSQDINGSPPPSDEFANYYGAATAHKLIVTYREYL